MNLHGLRLFHQVMRQGSITKAAKAQHISQPAVSSQLKAFEIELGLPLFEKEGRTLVPTTFALDLSRKAETLFALESHIETFLEDCRHARVGSIKIAATYLPANFLLPRWAGAFKVTYPDVNVMIQTNNSKQAFHQLANYKADVAMYAGSPEERPHEVEWDELFSDELWFVVSPSHPYASKEVSFATMAAQPFVMREEGSSTRARLYALCQANQVKTPKIALQFSGLNEALSAVTAGFGVNFVSSLVARDYIKRGLLARVYVQNVTAMNKIAICTRKNEQPSALVRQFISHCKQMSK
ncbi:DNA-binding transcriptional LysR family regulator [Alkalihalobacillus xiaoxiensis]|uniref:DNA-binding transcriptional LysR family regulator n=1 Tax=Shouchella xiaoxiensis TaxID=766895 RepID=A0ABS2SVV5_9BACI|nr:LysR family transcriptional regulator [Shouchella xiaoxiensis]MBM7839661.1 DNA-binding transcriptional LysR family regulator [Shouchella xiaoxiensis]